MVAVFSNTCKNASTSSWGVIFGSSLVACARASGSGTHGAAAAAWRAASSCSVCPCRVARCSTICCWRMLTSVRCFRSSSISGKGRSAHLWQRRGEKNPGGDENSQRMWCCLSVILHWLARILHHLSRGEESHDKDCSNKCPGGWIYWHKKAKKVANRCRSARVQSVLSSSVLVQGARARALVRLSGHTLLSTGVERWERESG